MWYNGAMEKFIWKDEYSVEIPSIDEQHKHFFEITNKVIGLSENPSTTKEDLLLAAGDLGNYAMYHLKTEEEYFDKFVYQDAPQHVLAHNLYREKVVYYIEAARTPEANARQLAEEMAEYSISWLSNHILILDKKYTVFFEQHGVK